MRHVAGALIAMAACGRIADGGDAGDASPIGDDASTTVDAPFHCDPTVPFDFNAAVPFSELNTGYSQGGLSLTPDELTAVFVRWDGGDDPQGPKLVRVSQNWSEFQLHCRRDVSDVAHKVFSVNFRFAT
jgi:hypothetical protein